MRSIGEKNEASKRLRSPRPDLNKANGLMPASNRLTQTLHDHDVQGERAIAIGQAAISSFILVLHLVAQFRTDWQGVNFWVIGTLVALILSSGLRFSLTMAGRLRNHATDLLTVVDVSIFLMLIWSYQFAYHHPAGGVLKAPSFILLVALVAMRALRFHPRPIIIAGVTAASGWCLIVTLSLTIDGAGEITHSYLEYLTSFKILLGAELEKFIALTAITVVLALATYRARRILSTAAHASDHAKALAAAQTNLEQAISSKEQTAVALAELQRQDEQLTSQNERFDAALKNMSQGLCMFDNEQRLIVCNESYASMYGLTPDLVKPGVRLQEIVEHRIANGIYAGETPEEYIRERLEWVASGERSTKIQELNDGRSISITHQPMSAGGWLTTHEDVTDRKRAEKLLEQQAEDLEAALVREKELSELQRQFVAMASHEFRTPLAIIDSTAQRLSRRAAKDELTPKEAIDRVNKIRDAVKRMARLMESTLTAARMESGKIGVEIGPCNVETVVRDVCSRQQELSKHHIISYDLAGLPANIEADPAALEQVFTNLLSNAVKYAPDAPKIDVVGYSRGDHVEISVRDYGLGIDEEDLPKMFERFFRARTSSGITGTGIGLNLARTLVEMHGGSIRVESRKDEGSLFTVLLPIAQSGQNHLQDDRAA